MSDSETESKPEQKPLTQKVNVEYNNLDLTAVTCVLFWVFGIALQHGFWDTFWAVIIPPYSMVVTATWMIDVINKWVGLI